MVYIPAVQRRAGCKGFKLNSAKRAFAKAKARERAEKVDTLLDGNAARKNQRFLTALYPRQYHPSVLEKPLISGFSLTMCFSAAQAWEKRKMRRYRRKTNF